MDEESSKRDEQFMILLEQALQLPSSEREPFLRRECADDALLFHEITEELHWDQRMGRFLLKPLLSCLDIEDPFRPGDLIGSRFLVKRSVGEGGMGVVYEAVDQKLNERRALKCAKPGFQPRLPAEAKAAIRISHENICRVCEIHSAETNCGTIEFLVMEFVRGETLNEYIKKKGRLHPSEADLIFRQLCKGLGAAHRQGLLHRDLKSNNVMITTNDNGSTRAVIMDFGLATDFGPNVASLQASGSLRGVLPYIAPELLRGSKATVASDIYSLGVIAYEMMTGRVPQHASLSGEPPAPGRPFAPNKLIPLLGSHLDQIILKCLAPDPAKRFSSTGEILHKLGRLFALCGRSMRMFRANSGSYLLVSILPAFLLITITFAVGRVTVWMIGQNSGLPDPVQQWQMMGWGFKLGFLVFFLLYAWVPVSLSQCGACRLAIQQREGHPIPLRSVLAEMPAFIPAGTIWSLLIGLPSMIPILAPWIFSLLGLTIPIMVADDLGLFPAIRRSLSLGRHIFGRVLLFFLTVSTLLAIPVAVFFNLVQLLAAFVQFKLVIALSMAFFGLTLVGSTIIGIIFTLFYYEALEKLDEINR